MAEYGADVQDLRALAKQFTDIASTLEETIRSLSVRISNSAAWRGPDADRFRSQWNTTDTARLRSTSQAISAAADTLRRNASEQESTSAAATGATVGMSSLVCSEPSVSTSSMYTRIRSDEDKNNDGMTIDKVVGSDGIERYVVYLDGTGGAGDVWNMGNRLSAYANGYKIFGINDSYITERMSKIPSGAEVMLVGYSQGGIDAQNIAASGKFNVTDVVTFGSPKVPNADPASRGVNVLQLEAFFDPVPRTDSVAANPARITGDALFDAAAGFLDPNRGATERFVGVGEGQDPIDIHGNQASYESVGRQFDNSTDPRFDTIRQSMTRYQGTVTRQD
ncbi:WXG100 family type VII secretion target [Rhodococcoides fascians]|uniref:WXG100 family type VII secretion target n=1 Tax=Rhodococcoides fascians TaxID=1828 RepID=UPI0006902B52|nr:WXG100 family type VII secretion target [Rhodococcus fascians]